MSAEMSTMAATHTMQKSMKGVSQAMQRCAKFITLPELQKSIQTYQMESEKMAMKQEMVSDCMDDAFEDASEEENELVEKVLDEVGLDLDGKLLDAPEERKAAQEGETVDDDLQKRLNNLKR